MVGGQESVALRPTSPLHSPPVVEKRWRIREAESEASARLAREIPCSPLVSKLLAKRGIADPGSAHRFLHPKLSHLHDPFALPGMTPAIDRIEEAIRRREPIAIFGDYDVDGISSTCLLQDFFAFIGYPVSYHLPNRLVDGYGLRSSNVRELAARGVKLIITVDNGSSATEEVELAALLGVDVVVTDHHLVPSDVPRAVAVVNPSAPGSSYPFKDLAGVGVAFKLIWALCQRLSRQTKVSDRLRAFLLESLALVALGTISDVVPLVGENRVLAHFGLRALEETKRPGLRRLVDSVRSRDEGARLEASHVGFWMGPRLNAAGRLGRAETAISLLLSQEDDEAQNLADTLESDNRRRQEIEREILESARELIRENVDLERDRAIVLGGEGWHAGVIGIVAARIAEEFARPTLLLTLDGERARGSARSVPGVHICRALASCAGHLAGFGGHEMAAGVEMSPQRIDDLRRALNEAITLRPEEMVPEIEVDAEVSLLELTPQALAEISLLEPFGHGNPRPLFVLRDAQVAGQPRLLGQEGRHLSFHLRQGGLTLRAIAFDKGRLYGDLEHATALSVLFRPKLSWWQGRSQVELDVREILRG